MHTERKGASELGRQERGATGQCHAAVDGNDMRRSADVGLDAPTMSPDSR